MLAEIRSAALQGVESHPVRVEVNLSSGLPSFTVVGLPESAVREGRDRVLTALKNSGLGLPPKKVVVNLAPADMRKEGSAFDLPIAVGLLVACEHLPPEPLRGWAFLGELGLDGTVRPVHGILPAASGCREEGLQGIVVPRPNAREAALVDGLTVLGVRSVRELRAHFLGERSLPPTRVDLDRILARNGGTGPDLSDVRGQVQAKRALEVSAAGAHNLLLAGPPGSGKTMLARRLSGILPPLSLEEALEVTKIHSVAGLLSGGEALVRRRPFRSPHHTTSDAGLVGGGSSPRPGEASLAHHGVLFLDELPEFRRPVLEALRQPVEEGAIALSRARISVRYPARFVLVAAMNPCPCGHLGDGSERCTCDPGHVRRYRGRVSGPLLDRIDLHVEVPAVPPDDLGGSGGGPSTAEVRERVLRARERQRSRFQGLEGIFANSHMGPREVHRFCAPSLEVARLLRPATDRLHLSARAYHRILKVARTIADLGGFEEVEGAHAAEAIQYREPDRSRSL